MALQEKYTLAAKVLLQIAGIVGGPRNGAQIKCKGVKPNTLC